MPMTPDSVSLETSGQMEKIATVLSIKLNADIASRVSVAAQLTKLQNKVLVWTGTWGPSYEGECGF
jgi:hypothetical protein